MLRGELRYQFTNQIVLKATFPVSLTPPYINEEGSTLAYPRMAIKKEHIGTFPCDQYRGKILEHLPNGTGYFKIRVLYDEYGDT